MYMNTAATVMEVQIPQSIDLIRLCNSKARDQRVDFNLLPSCYYYKQWASDSIVVSARRDRSLNTFVPFVVVSLFISRSIPHLKRVPIPGHCFCAPCVVKNKKSGNILCPFCRAVIKNDNGHPIYVTFNDPDVDDSDAPSSDALPETVVRQARYVTKRLDRMDAGSSSLKTVKMAEDHLSNVAALLEPSKLVEVRVTNLLSCGRN